MSAEVIAIIASAIAPTATLGFLIWLLQDRFKNIDTKLDRLDDDIKDLTKTNAEQHQAMAERLSTLEGKISK